MLLEKIERIANQSLNAIFREVEKRELCKLDYDIITEEVMDTENRKTIQITYFDHNAPFLVSNSYITVNGMAYTTFESQTIYKDFRMFETIDNPPFNVRKCNVQIGFINKYKYLHLPDFLATQTLTKGIPLTAVTPDVILKFGDNVVTVYSYNGKVYTPYYLFGNEFEYNENAELLAKIIGVFDAYKRGLLNKIGNKTLWYFFYPYVSLVLYKNLRSTLYPSFMRALVYDVINTLHSEGEEILNGYRFNTIDKLENDINAFNESSTIIDF